uniref:Uncharacterized protein n=1 Tax=Clandestinovirus TaxID=2831644 RepID=A0A8F8KPR0_9VIRU|nr:hypothetical protein KOM_12_528 [Clandestinovirus]
MSASNKYLICLSLMENMDMLSTKLDETITRTDSIISQVEKLCSTGRVRLTTYNSDVSKCDMHAKMNVEICQLPQSKYLAIGEALTSHITTPKKHDELITCFCRHVPPDHYSIVEYLNVATPSYIVAYTIMQFLSDKRYKVSFIKALLDDIGLDILPIILRD